MSRHDDFFIENSILIKYTGCGGDVIIPEGVEKIGPGAFDECLRLTRVTLPESLLSIEFHAFLECRSLTGITIPQKVRTIGPWAFFNCKRLQNIILLGAETAPAVKSEDPFEEVDAPIAAPNLPLGNMPAFWKPRAVWGVAGGINQYSQLRQGEYLKYIKSQRKKLYPLAVQHEALLLLMLGEKMIPQKDIALLSAEANRQNNTTAQERILAYQP